MHACRDFGSYDPSWKGKGLSAKETAAIRNHVRRPTASDEDAAEIKPLPTMAKARAGTEAAHAHHPSRQRFPPTHSPSQLAMTGKTLQPTRQRKLGSDLEGLCTAANESGTIIVVGCKDSRLLVGPAGHRASRPPGQGFGWRALRRWQIAVPQTIW